MSWRDEMDELEHIQPGTAYHDGEAHQLYDPDDPGSVEEFLFQRCIDYNVGALSVHACLNTSEPSLSVEVKLLGTVIGRCELSPSRQNCRIGGAIDGYKAEVSIGFQLDPPAVVLDGTLCVPMAGCKQFHVVIPIGR